MSDEDQERLEDYLKLEDYIEGLQAGKAVHPPTNLTPEQVQVYQMATLFHAATDDNAEPRPEFVEQLKAQLLEANTLPPVAAHEPAPPLATTATEAPAMKGRSSSARPARFFSRRGLLTGGAAAAASLVIGTGIGVEVQKERSQPTTTPSPASYPQRTGQPLQIPADIPTRWLFVTTLASLGDTAVRFMSDAIVGHVIRAGGSDDWGTGVESVKAFSATCTHMGCLVQWKNTDRQFHCPCHGAAFNEQGTQVANHYPYQLPPLVSLRTKVEDGKVYVEVPL